MKTDFAKAFRIIRAASGLSQSELAHRIGISASHLSLIENGRRQPSLKVISNIAQVAGAPPSLVMLLASPLESVEDDDISGLAKALVRLLVHPSDFQQQTLPLERAQ